MLKVKFIEHSSFLVETQDAYLLFDYYFEPQNGVARFQLEDENKPLYVMNSHAHGDHYSPVIFDLPRLLKHNETRFILSSDIKNAHEKIISLAPHELVTLDDGVLTIETLASNDVGVAFWCQVSGYKIYHAGDLNNWLWDGNPEDKNRVQDYHRELARIAGRTADVAFIPLDPRLEKVFPVEPYLREFPIHANATTGFIQPKPSKITAYALGIEDFMQYADAKEIYPMHMWGKFGLIERFCALPETAAYSDRIVRLS